jgi:hypothetical protein
MSGNKISTKLIERSGDEAFKKRKQAMLDAWREWYHSVITAMGEQVKREDLDPDALVSEELGTLQEELDHCEQVGHVLFGFMHDDDDSSGEQG